MSVRDNFDMECPSCHKDNGLIITAHVEVRLRPDGSDTIDCNHEWDNDSCCRCDNCQWSGRVKDCDTSLQESQDEPCTDPGRAD